LSRRRNRKKNRAYGRTVEASPAVRGSFEEGAALVSGLLEARQLKQALEEAKSLHRRESSPSSESLLIEAYLAKVDAFSPSMATEAAALLDLVEGRHPQARTRTARLRLRLAARAGRFEDLLRTLADDSTPKEVREDIERMIREDATDLDALAACPSLPPEHALRVAASEVLRALSTVTSEPIEDESLSGLPLSRRSPLAPWKFLLRAIGCFYREEDEAVEELAAAIEPGAAPAPLGRALVAMVKGERLESPALRSLATSVGGDVRSLREALVELDRAFERENPRPIREATRTAIRLCRTERPELAESLKQRISVKAFILGVPAEKLQATLGGPSLHDARFWRLLAHALEGDGDAVLACAAWEEFRRNALEERWFEAGGPEEAAIYSKMIGLMLRLDRESRRKVKEHFPRAFPGFGAFYVDQPEAIRARAPPGRPDAYFLDLETLFERCAECDPDPETFRQWLSWGKTEPGWKSAERAALAWSRARPEDAAPLVHLAFACEARSALKKAISFLERAEKLDRLHPDVRRARRRLLTATAVRHFQSRNLGLVSKDIAEIERLSDAEEGDRPALTAALGWLRGALAGNGEERVPYDAVTRAFEDEMAASCFLHGLAEASKLGGPLFMAPLPSPASPAQGEAGRLSKAIARAAALGVDVGLSIPIPRGWEDPLRRDLESSSARLEPRELRMLAEVALGREENEIAYVASGHGLSHGEPHTARFLLLRAESLPPWESDRIRDCLSAAVELARGHRDMELVASIVDAGRFRTGLRLGFGFPSDAAASAEKAIPDVVKREREDKAFPRWSGSVPEPLVECQCDFCRRERRAETAPFQRPLFEDDEDEGLVFDELDDSEDEEIPPEVLGVLLEMEKKYGPSVDPEFIARKDPAIALRLAEALERSGFRNRGNEPPPRRKRRSKRKRKGKP